jgi:hypothetical protein
MVLRITAGQAGAQQCCARTIFLAAIVGISGVESKPRDLENDRGYRVADLRLRR